MFFQMIAVLLIGLSIAVNANNDHQRACPTEPLPAGELPPVGCPPPQQPQPRKRSVSEWLQLRARRAPHELSLNMDDLPECEPGNRPTGAPPTGSPPTGAPPAGAPRPHCRPPKGNPPASPQQ